MRLGRKLAEGFAVDHEADRACSRAAPEAEPATPVAATQDAFDPVLPEPVRAGHARTGSRAGD